VIPTGSRSTKAGFSSQEEPFEATFREFYGPVLGFFGKRQCTEEECQDLAQETFLRAYRGFGGFKGNAKPLTWLLTIATNVWNNKTRDAMAAKRAGKEVELYEQGQPGMVIGERAQGEVLETERREHLRHAVELLPPRMRQCVFLRIYQERSFGEISALLGITPETAKSQVSLAKAKLRTLIAEHYPDVKSGFPGG
jgi:RNA polymerase sigma-70 factor (ECF subfamily)